MDNLPATEPAGTGTRKPFSSPPWAASFAIFAAYAVVMAYTNLRFTFLDDEAGSIGLAGHPALGMFRQFFAGTGLREEHPPLSNALLHLWLVATSYSFFGLRIFANLFYIAGLYCTSRAAGRIAGERASRATLIIGCAWPFAFQYGRIDGWYAIAMFLVSLVSWAYVEVLEDSGRWPWIGFAAASVLLVWCNYFGFVFLFLLLADLLIFHRELAGRRIGPLLGVMVAVAVAFLPVLWIVLSDLSSYLEPVASRFDWKNEIAVFGYPAFAIFGSAAIAPWYLPLSVPVVIGVIALFAAIWRSEGRRWLVYFLLAMLMLQISTQMGVKRILFMLPWLFIAIAGAAFGERSRARRLACVALGVIVTCGWIGIMWGQHYATTNLYEPWEEVARVVAQDARNGASVVSDNWPFFLYLNYQLGLESMAQEADHSYLGRSLCRAWIHDLVDSEDKAAMGSEDAWQGSAGEWAIERRDGGVDASCE